MIYFKFYKKVAGQYIQHDLLYTLYMFYIFKDWKVIYLSCSVGIYRYMIAVSFGFLNFY